MVFPAIEKFAENIRAKCNLELQWAKCKVYLREGELPPETPDAYLILVIFFHNRILGQENFPLKSA